LDVHEKQILTMLGIEAEAQYEWIVIGEPKNEILAYKKPNEDPVFVNAEGAVLQMIKTLKELRTVHLNTSHILADLSRMI
jgi:hypothetical protein